jgi:2-oxoglutarate dehydrogenase E2 component (dihydrolipoamide succinyltransferase)
MIIELKIPSAGESITEVAIGNWLIEDKTYVEKDQEIAEVESDKATLPLIAPDSGIINILIPAGAKAQVGDIAGTLDTSAKSPAQDQKTSRKKSEAAPAKEPEATLTKEMSQGKSATGKKEAGVVPREAASEEKETKPEQKQTVSERKEPVFDTNGKDYTHVKVTPLARNIMDDHNLDVDSIIQGLKKLTRQDVERVVNQFSNAAGQPLTFSTPPIARTEETTPLSPLRRKLSKRLIAVKNETAMLTTFNEVDMSAVLELRKKHQQAFVEKHGIKLGLMSFFMKAAAEALRAFPRVNSMIDGDNMITPRYVDIAVAVQTEKGLMVPVIRNIETLSLAGIEKALAEMAKKARAARLSIEEMTVGTFTITNGGVFGSMLSTPILNPPQSAILGMHNIVERPVAINGKVEIRPVMYVALSYDHRLIDGSDSVSFLVKIKEQIESPFQMITGGRNPEKMLLDL